MRPRGRGWMSHSRSTTTGRTRSGTACTPRGPCGSRMSRGRVSRNRARHEGGPGGRGLEPRSHTVRRPGCARTAAVWPGVPHPLPTTRFLPAYRATGPAAPDDVQGSTKRDSRNYEQWRWDVTPTQATENAAELIRKAEETAGDPARARVLLECADRWL